jgi:hypothetical protein
MKPDWAMPKAVWTSRSTHSLNYGAVASARQAEIFEALRRPALTATSRIKRPTGRCRIIF